MKKSILAMILSGAAVLSASATDIDIVPGRVNGTRQITVSRGHNLSGRASSIDASAPTPFKALPGAHARKAPGARTGLRVDGRRPAAPKVLDETSAVFFESFENTSLFTDDIPEGWSQHSEGSADLDVMDRWIGFSKAYAEAYMFPVPAQGDMMLGMFYNDDADKDEWLVSPEVNIPAENYQLSFYWYTRPNYLYVIDREHVDYEEEVFISREILFDVEVLVKTADTDWTVVYDLEEEFSDMEYRDLWDLDYDVMQKAIVDLGAYAGKDIQIAFRYWGKGGNTFCLDAVRVDLPLPEVSFQPDYSRLFYGFDRELWWFDASVEFYPVNYTVSWTNTSPNRSKNTYNWAYHHLGADGTPIWDISDNSRRLEVTYTPDYSSPEALVNNLYYLPRLKAQGPEGGISDFVTSTSDFLQAGGTPEFTIDGADGPVHTKYFATNFDIINEGLGYHEEEDSELGFFAEPIFGRSVNTDAWWEHYCFPNGKTEGKYAYVDGFLNMYLPHPTAPLVVNGVTAAALGTIYDGAQFTMRVYTMDTDGAVIETPIVEKTITGADVDKITGPFGRDYLILDFPLDTPVIFDAEGTGYGYLVEISGYHDENIEYFAPLQSTVPNEYEWCLSFYHIHHSGHSDLTNEISYVAFFKDYLGRDMYTSFAIGLDAHYPWLDLYGGDDAFTKTADGEVTFTLRGYYDGADYKVTAPEGVNVSLKGRYETVVTVSVPAGYADETVPVTFEAPGVSLDVDVPVTPASITDITADADAKADVYNAQGVLIRRAASADDVRALPAGLYIHGKNKIIVK